MPPRGPRGAVTAPGRARRIDVTDRSSSPSGLPWARIAAMGAGLVVGAILGAQYGFAASQPWSGFFPPTVPLTLTIIGLVGILGIVGLVMAIPRGTRPSAPTVLIAAGMVLAGLPIGAALGPTWQAPRTMTGSVELSLAAPVSVTLAAPARCETVANGDSIGSITADLGRVGIDHLELFASFWASGSFVRLTVNSLAGYEGSFALDALDGGSRAGGAPASGEGQLARLRSSGLRIGGPSGPSELAATLAWRCDEPAVAPSFGHGYDTETAELQGWFSLSGIVDYDPMSIENPTSPLLGRADAVCRRSVDLRVDQVSTVVPWLDGARARLDLAFDRRTGRLTVTPDDGGPVERATAPVTVEERTGGGVVRDRTLTGVFDLPSGRLVLGLEWSCSDNVEPPATSR